MVLFGLPRLTIEIIKNEFVNELNITPVSVTEIKTKKSSVDDALYMIEFNRQQVSKNEVLKIKYFCNIAVYWRRPL